MSRLSRHSLPSKLIILVRFSPSLFHRILGFILRHFRVHDLARVEVQLVQHVLAVNDDVGQLFFDMLDVVLVVAPLKAFQKLTRLDGDRLGQVGRRVKLIPVAVFCEFPDAVYR